MLLRIPMITIKRPPPTPPPAMLPIMVPRSSPPPPLASIPRACRIMLPAPPPIMPASEFPKVPKLWSLRAAPATLPPTAPLRRLIIKLTISIRPPYPCLCLSYSSGSLILLARVAEWEVERAENSPGGLGPAAGQDQAAGEHGSRFVRHERH